ncbi:hypothetical protein [Parvularcula lutaonensis]|uniref:Uncharacterized protein n=1 Tax=Parvularcula lutaonensis TaxID=491923 RepID=A0ABV7MAM5_9PROT|nr:hypothetical protein [Parvularcula lutaonensis]GGY37604.1 hypothetical protein GCM10007148_02350 [Parvularcula lutaonensis]
MAIGKPPRGGYSWVWVESFPMKSLRFTAWIMIALALALVGADLVSSLEAGQPVVRTTREIFNLLPGVAINPLGTEGALGALNLAMDLPLWAIVGGIGLLATILVRPVD